MATDGARIRVRASGRVKVPRLDNGALTKIGNDMVVAQKKRWAFGVNSDGNAAKRLSVKYSFEKAKYTGTRNPLRDMKMTGRTVENFQLRKAMDQTIRAENTTRLERAKAQRAQQAEDMIGFAPTDQIVVFRAADEQYGAWVQKAWVPLSMIDLKELTSVTVETFRAIPEVIEIVTDPTMIVPYLYQGATQNKLQRAIYKTAPGSILVAWIETVANETTEGWWLHRFHYVLRGVPTGSPLDLLTALLNGVPVPGDGQRWRLCGLMAGLNPAKILEISRQPDEEGIDYIAVTAEMLETGDA